MKMFHIIGHSRFQLDRVIGPVTLPLWTIPPHPLYFVCCSRTGLSLFSGLERCYGLTEQRRTWCHTAPLVVFWTIPEEGIQLRVVHQRGQSLDMTISPHRYYSTVSQALLPSLFQESTLINWFNGMILTNVS